MDILKWDESFSVGIKSIDDQHKRLVTCINTLYREMSLGKGKEVLASIMEELLAYTQTHFAYEEELFERLGYPDGPSHREEHLLLIKKVQEYSGGVNVGSRTSALTVSNFLKDWLYSHILNTDKKYASFFAGHGIE